MNACCSFLSPIGRIYIEGSEEGLCRIEIRKDKMPPLPPDSPALSAAAREITEYLEGKRKRFSVPTDPEGTSFERRVWEKITRIPYGKTVSYKKLAEMIGAPGSARAVANACGKNPLPIIIPCPRVVLSSGKAGGY